jgi:hypothetical protein
MKDNSSGRIVRSSPGSKRSYNSTGRIRSWVNPTEATKKKKKKKKNTSPLIISHFPPQSQVFLIKKIKKFFVKYLTNICSLYSK